MNLSQMHSALKFDLWIVTFWMMRGDPKSAPPCNLNPHGCLSNLDNLISKVWEDIFNLFYSSLSSHTYKKLTEYSLWDRSKISDIIYNKMFLVHWQLTGVVFPQQAILLNWLIFVAVIERKSNYFECTGKLSSIEYGLYLKRNIAKIRLQTEWMIDDELVTAVVVRIWVYDSRAELWRWGSQRCCTGSPMQSLLSQSSRKVKVITPPTYWIDNLLSWV